MKRGALWKYLLAIVLALAVTGTCRKLFMTEGVEVGLIAEASAPVEYRVDFHGAGGAFSDALSVRQASGQRNAAERFSFFLPAKEITGIRLTFRSEGTPGAVRVQELSINGRIVDVPEALRQGATAGMEGMYAEGGVVFTLREPTASLLLPEAMSRARAQRRYDKLPLFSVFMMSYLALSGAAHWAANRLTAWRDGVSAAFLLSVGLMLTLPMVKLRAGDVSENENRHLCPPEDIFGRRPPESRVWERI